MVDMAHFAGLVAAGAAPEPGAVRRRRDHDGPQDARRRPRRHDPVPARSTPRRSTRRCSPASRAGRSSTSSPARRSRCKIAATELFRERQRRTHRGRAGGRRRSCSAPATASSVLTGGTDVHLVLVDLRESELDGQQAEDRLHEIGITVNRNAVPFDPRPPVVTSRAAHRHAGAGDPRAAGRRLRARSAASSPARCSPASTAQARELAERVTAIAERYPLYAQLGPRAAVYAAASRGGRARAAAAARPPAARAPAANSAAVGRSRASRASAPRPAAARTRPERRGAARAAGSARSSGGVARAAVPRERPRARERVVQRRGEAEDVGRRADHAARAGRTARAPCRRRCPIGPRSRAARRDVRATLRSIRRGGAPMTTLSGLTSRCSQPSPAM